MFDIMAMVALMFKFRIAFNMDKTSLRIDMKVFS